MNADNARAVAAANATSLTTSVKRAVARAQASASASNGKLHSLWHLCDMGVSTWLHAIHNAEHILWAEGVMHMAIGKASCKQQSSRPKAAGPTL